MPEKINIEGQEISIKQIDDQDYISLTDIARQRDTTEPGQVIRTWLGNQDTEDFLEIWESTYNPDFKPMQMHRFKNFRQRHKRAPSIKEYLEQTEAKGIISKSGRYGGTFAHKDIAFEFASWVSAPFKLRMIIEFQRLRSEEAQRQRIEWNAGRELARLNYPIQTAAIKEVSGSLPEKKRGGAYASEADLINELVFGMTAKQWRIQNPDAKGNLRDNANTLQNVLIANLENLNAYLLKNGASYEARWKVLAKTVADQTDVLEQKYLPE